MAVTILQDLQVSTCTVTMWPKGLKAPSICMHLELARASGSSGYSWVSVLAGTLRRLQQRHPEAKGGQTPAQALLCG